MLLGEGVGTARTDPDEPVATPDRAPSPRLLFVVTEDWYFCSHRLPTARAARALGFDVAVATRLDRHADQIRAEGIRALPLPPLRQMSLPFGPILAILALVRLYRREHPDIIHHVALVPTLFGAIAAALAGARRCVSTVTGLGFVFTSTSLRSRIIRTAITPVLRILLSHRRHLVVFQNQDDLDLFVARGIVAAERCRLLRGSGVDTDRLRPSPELPGPITATFVGRMLRSKGVVELVEAARILRDRGTAIRIVLVGTPDPRNPDSLDEADLLGWQADGLIEWQGFRADIAAVWAEAHIALLPSYREGLPKSLLEAAACGRAMIATDVPGCREIVRPDRTGLLVPPRDATALAEALWRLAGDPSLRRRLGEAARADAETLFSDRIVATGMQALYRDGMSG